MRFNFKKISAVAISTLLTGMTMGVAAAASYPAPFVSGGVANTAVVYGTGAGVSDLDKTYAGNIQTDLQKYVTSSGGSTTVEGDVVSLDTSSTRIWINTSLNTAKSTLTKSDLPVVLEDFTFSGDVDAKLTSTLKIGSGVAAGGDNSNKVIFAKQPKSSNEPTIGISLATSAANPLYNATVTTKAINFTSSDSEGETIQLFGKEFVVSTATDTNDLVLFSSAKEATLTIGGSSPVSSTTLNVAGKDYVVTLVSGSDTTATIDVNGDSKEVNEGSSKKIGGIDVAIKNVDESEAINTITATLLVGSEKITFTNGQAVAMGSEDDPVDGTIAYLKGGTTALTELAVAVYRPDSSNDAINAGESFTDPVFKSFKVDFEGLSTPLADTTREILAVQNSGDDDANLRMTDSSGNEKTFIFAHNQSTLHLADDSNYTIHVKEMANATEGQFVVLGNEDYGHLLEVATLTNNSASYTNNKVKLQDVISGETFDAVFTSVCLGATITAACGTISIDGKSYDVVFNGQSSDDGWVQFKYPTADSANSATFVVYPTIETEAGAKVALYEPLTFNLATFNGSATKYTSTTINFPDGDGYTGAVFTYIAGDADDGNWTLGSSWFSTGASPSAGNTTANITVGTLVYSFSDSGTVNQTKLYLVDPEGTAMLNEPAVVMFEGKDDNSAYEAIVIDLETAPAADSNSGLGVDDVLFTTNYGHYSATLASDNDITQDVDWFGTLVTTDAGDSDQKTVEIAYPKEQAYAKIFVGEESAVIGGSETGVVLVTDAEIASVSSKDLVIVGGSCINSAAAKVLGFSAPTCGAAFTASTGVGSGQFLIKSVSGAYTSGKVALVVAGYEAADTVNAAQYLINKKPDTSKNYKGTSATVAEEIVTSA